MRTQYNALYDYGMKLSHDETLTKDCIQEVFLAYWNSRDTWPSLRSVRAYLLVSMRHRIIDAYREARRSVPFISLADADEPVAVLDLSFGDELPGESETTALTALLDQLPRRQREALYLRYFAEMDYVDVAQAMGVKERTVYNLVHEGVQQLRQMVANSPGQRMALLRSLLFFLKIFVG